MKNKIVLTTMILSGFLSNAQVTLDWYNYPGGVSIATDDSNNVYTATWDYNPAGDISLTKRNATGAVLWNANYDNLDNTTHEVATWVETDSEGNILVSGIIRSGFSNPVNAASLLMKYNPSGVLLWRVVYENPFEGSSTRKCLVDTDNNIYVLGIGTGPNGQVTKVKKFNSSGVSLWDYYDAGIGAPVNFKFTPDNNILISHRSIFGIINSYQKIDLDGNLIWSFINVSSSTIGDAAGDVFGNTYIINGENVILNPGSILTKLDPTGSVIWSQTNSMTGTKVEVGTDNNPVICGFPNIGTFGAAFMKFDSEGNTLWENLDADGPSYTLLLHAQMKLDEANSAYLAAGTLFEMAICKVNHDGSSAWVATAPGSYANAFEIGTDNNIYVTGGTTARFGQPPVISCETPFDLSSPNISGTKAKLKWSLVSSALFYQVLYKKVSDTVWKKRFINGNSTSVVLKNLSCGTNYEWKIRTICDTVNIDASEFSAVQNFFTLNCGNYSREFNTETNDNDDATINDLIVYPSVTNDFITIEMKQYSIENTVKLRIFDMAGRVVIDEIIQLEEASLKEINVSAYQSGLYFVELEKNNKIFFSKFIKE